MRSIKIYRKCIFLCIFCLRSVIILRSIEYDLVLLLIWSVFSRMKSVAVDADAIERVWLDMIRNIQLKFWAKIRWWTIVVYSDMTNSMHEWYNWMKCFILAFKLHLIENRVFSCKLCALFWGELITDPHLGFNVEMLIYKLPHNDQYVSIYSDLWWFP